MMDFTLKIESLSCCNAAATFFFFSEGEQFHVDFDDIAVIFSILSATVLVWLIC